MSNLTAAEALEIAAKESVDYNHNLNLGTFIIASGTDMLLCGMMIVQLINYWTWSKGDRMFNKSIVIITSLSSFLATIFIIVLMFKLFVYHFGTYAPFASLNLLVYMSIIDIIPSVATQVCFTERAYKLCNRSKLLVGAITICLLVSIVGAVGMPPIRAAVQSGKVDAEQKKVFMYMWLCGSLSADLMITTSIMWSLMKSKTGWKDTDDTISRLIRVMVETQLPPTLLVIFFFIVTFGFPLLYLDIFALWVQSKFYTCGLLASLNSRYSLRRTTKNDSSNHGRTNKTGPVVHVLTETYVQNGVPAVSSTINHNSNQSHRPTYTHTPHRMVRKDPLDLDIDDDSIELEDKTPQNSNPHENEVHESHKLDYIDNASKTGLTDNIVYSGKRE
ncbi:hypothetical protein I203_103544 [Kwoniella mangroviensis CBS 8507]|uniref:uncharacterized protein n=1 Tax=Kwoniella mangroviensis CBS 8507 TaxID=1296122 RepID=UPI00080CD5E6|nr:uncharacterized protein I203_04356 [Kwoniella mangroviensis CBS 8507]OCF66779.1 hypothetical protein I203_04356 [Kwoniella mangroviensis CBS 8507]